MSKYRDYLASAGWRERRQQAVQRAAGVCETTGCDRPARDVHHLTYRHLGREYADEIVHLCSSCHRQQHPALSGRRSAKSIPCPVCGRKQKGHGGLQRHVRHKHSDRYYELYGISVGHTKL